MHTVDAQALKRTARVLDWGTWGIIAGMVTYSVATSTPFVQRHSPWENTGWILGAMMDIAFIMALQADSVLARHGVTDLGKWPAIFRWFTGLSTTFLNVWDSVAKKDWTGVAIHALAPVLLLIVSEVGPVWRNAMANVVARAEAKEQVNEVDTPTIVQPEPAPVVIPAPVVQPTPAAVPATVDTHIEEAVQLAKSGRTPKPSKADIKAALAKLADKGVAKQKDIDEALAGLFSVSTRTARRYIKEVTA